MSEVESLYVRLLATTSGFKASMAGAAADGESFTATMQRGMKGVAGFAVLGAAAVALVGVKSIDMAMKFQAATERIRTQAGATQGEVLKVRDAIYKLAPQVGFGPMALAEAFYHVESAGYRGAKAVDVVAKSAMLAKVGASDLAETTNAVVGILQSGWVNGAHAAGQAVSLLNAIVGAGNMKMGDLVGALSTGIAAASVTFGVSMQSTGAALALMTDQGVPAQMAATHLRMSMALLGAPTKAATKYLRDLGISSADAGTQVSATQVMLEKAGVQTTQLAADMRKPDGFLVALTDLKDHMVKAGLSAYEQSALISRSFGGGKSGAAIMQMYTNLDLLHQKFLAIGAGSTKFGEDWAATQNTMQQQVDKTKARITTWLTEMGMKLLPVATRALKGLNDVFSWLGAHQTVLKAIGAAFAGVIATGLAMAAAAAWAFVAPFLAVAAPIAAVSAGLYLLYEKCKPFREEVNKIAADVVVAFGKVREFIGKVIGELSALYDKHAANLIGALHDVEAVFKSVFAAVGAAVGVAVEVITALWDRFGKQLLEHLVTAWNAIVQVFRGVLRVFKGVFDVFEGIFTLNWTKVWGGIQEIFSGVWDAIIGVAKFAWNTVSTVLGAGVAALSYLWQQIWHAMEQVLGHFGGFVMNDVLKPVVDAFLGFAQQILHAAAAAFGWVPGLGGKLKEARDAVDNFRTSTDQTMSGWADSMYGFGTAAGDGIANGLTDSQAKVAAAAAKLGGAGTGALAMVLKTGSPSKVTYQFGIWAGEGLVNGMLAMKDKVAEATKVMGSGALQAAALRAQQTPLDTAATALLGVQATFDPLQDRWEKLTAAVHRADQAHAQAVASLKAAKDNLEAVKDATTAHVQALEDEVRGQHKVSVATRQAIVDAKRAAQQAVEDATLKVTAAQAVEKATAATAAADAKAAKDALTRVQSTAQALLAAQQAFADALYQQNLANATKAADAAHTALTAILTEAKTLRDGFSQSVLANGSIVDLFTTGAPAGTVLGTGDVIKALQAKLDAARKFASDMGKLTGIGLSSQMISQIAAAGPATGDAIAQALLTAAPGTVDQINQLMGSINDTAAHGVDGLASTLYGTATNAITSYLAGLAAKYPELQAMLDQINAEVIAAFGGTTPGGVYRHGPGPGRLTLPTPTGSGVPTGGSGVYHPRAGDTIVHVVVQGNVTAEKDLAESIRQSLLRDGARNNRVGSV